MAKIVEIWVYLFSVARSVPGNLGFLELVAKCRGCTKLLFLNWPHETLLKRLTLQMGFDLVDEMKF